MVEVPFQSCLWSTTALCAGECVPDVLFHLVRCISVFLTLRATMPTAEIMLSPQPFGNNMEFKCCAQLSAEPCWETNKFNKTLQDRLSNTACVA